MRDRSTGLMACMDRKMMMRMMIDGKLSIVSKEKSGERPLYTVASMK